MRNLSLKNMSIIIVVAVFVLAAANSFGQDEEFRVKGDGEITVGGYTFSSMQEYVQSDYFRENDMRCGVRMMAGANDGQLAKSTADCTAALTAIQNEYWPAVSYTLPVWWHVIYRSDSVGNISDATIKAQMAALNEDYRAQAGTLGGNGFDVKIEFELVGITRTMNDAWFADSSVSEKAFKQALKVDPSKFVNIYTNDGGGYLGYAYYPQGSAGSYLDGIVLNYQAVGGRNNSFYPYHQGRTLVHEMGHYLGLVHTFEGGCNNGYNSGDLILDTNAEAAPNYQECSSASSCGSPDPIHNYMDYSYDHCMYLFTREQANRAVCSLVNYRASQLTVVPAGTTNITPLFTPLILKE